MGKKGEINKIKKFLKKEGKDKRGMANEDLEEITSGRKILRRGFLAGALAAVMAAGCALLPGYNRPHISQEYNNGELEISIKSPNEISRAWISYGNKKISLRPRNEQTKKINIFGVRGESTSNEEEREESSSDRLAGPTKIHTKLRFNQLGTKEEGMFKPGQTYIEIENILNGKRTLTKVPIKEPEHKY